MSPAGDAEVRFVLVTYERAAEVREVLRALERHARMRYALTVVDNRSGPEVQALLRDTRERHPEMSVVRNFQNRFCGGATNQALALTREPYVIYLCAHECFVLQDGFDERCVTFMEAAPRVAQAGHLIASPAYADGRGYQALSTFEHFRNPDYAEKRRDDRFFHVQGVFYVLRMEAVRRSGAFNPAIPHDHMDVEYSYFLESEGWEIADLPFVMSIHRNTRPRIEGYDPGHAVYHPLTPAEARGYEAQASAQALRGRSCAACGWKGPCFDASDGASAHAAAHGDDLCPACGSRPCHRALAACAAEPGGLGGRCVLEVAPAPRLAGFLESAGAKARAMDPHELAASGLPDESFDLVLCHDALERVADDRAMVAAIARALRPGGRALIRVAQNRHRWRTLERVGKGFPGDGCERDPGLDYAERLAGCGLGVRELQLSEAFDLDRRVLEGIYQDVGTLFELSRAV